MNVTKKSIAVFDIDGTLFRSSLLVRLIASLVRKDPAFAKRAKEQFGNWTNDLYYGRLAFDDYTNNLVEAFRNWIKGLPYGIFGDIAAEVAEAHVRLVFRYTMELFKKLEKEGKHYLVAISHSPYSVVQPFCKKLGFDDIYATNYETNVGNPKRFTGAVNKGIFDQDKAQAFDRVLSKNGLSIEGSVGVGDSKSDIAFLAKVQHPIAFNPDEELERWARQHNSEIILEDAQKLRIRYIRGAAYFRLKT